MGEEASWFVLMNGHQQGPMSEFRVNEMIREGQVEASAKVVGPQYTEWTPITNVMAFAPLFSGFGNEEELSDWIVNIDGVDQAPEPEATVSDRIRAGQIPETAQVRGPGTPQWTPIGNVMAYAALYHGFGSGTDQVNQELACSPVGEDEPWMRLPGWHAAYTGLNLYYKAILLAILQVLLIIALPLVILLIASTSRGADPRGAVTLFNTFTALVRLGWVAVAVLMLVGLVYYTRMPVETGARGLATVAMVLCSVSLLVIIYTLVAGLVNPEPALQTGGGKAKAASAVQVLVSAISGLTSAVGLCLLLLSMMKVARFIGQDGVAVKARNTLILATAVFGGQIAIAVIIAPMLQARGAGGGLIAFVIQMGMAILSFICLGMFISTVNGMRTALLVAET